MYTKFNLKIETTAELQHFTKHIFTYPWLLSILKIFVFDTSTCLRNQFIIGTCITLNESALVGDIICDIATPSRFQGRVFVDAQILLFARRLNARRLSNLLRNVQSVVSVRGTIKILSLQ